MKLKKEKKEGQKKQIHRDEVKKRKEKNTGVSFVDWKSFKTNKRVFLFCRKLVSRSRNLNQLRSKNLLFFCQFTILTPFSSFR